MFKPENDKDLLKAIEDMENLAAKALQEIYANGGDWPFTEALELKIENILNISRLSQQYLKEK